ncbi:hypothetical protein VTN77DRAFT_8378 [Rasamsonia byssochlamydoides]|uniref:uncharacterized protein n=1 Tax=Rasamsonia byssochlamydoides TaxID=89139 RepID=UPI0037432B45
MEGVGQSLALNKEQHQPVLSYDNIVTQPHQTMLSTQSRTCDFPYQHFALIYINQDGEVGLETSPSIGNSGKSIFTPEVRERFLKTATMGSQATTTSFAGPTCPVRNEECEKQSPIPDQSYRPSEGGIWSQPSALPPAQLIPCDWQFHQNKRQRRSAKRRDQRGVYADVDYDVVPLSPPIRRTAIRVDDEPRMKKYYEKAFEAFQQLNCRVIAKAFIKLVEPRKQVNHPYNGRRASSGSSPERADPELTKPKWWPSGVTHKEPDHLLKAERIRLLIHILRELRESHGITAEKLREAGQDVRRQITPVERLKVLDEIYNVRQAEERYLSGEISKDTLIPISQVHLSGPEFEIVNAQEASIAFSGSRVDSSTWLREGTSQEGGRGDGSPTASSMSNGLTVPVTPTATTPYSHDTVHMTAERPSQSQEFCLTVGPSPCIPTTKASSFESSLLFISSQGTMQSAVVSSDVSGRPVEAIHHSDRPCLPSYLNQPMLVSPPASAAPTVFWDPSIHTAAPVYQPTY